ncbi:MAG: hypothetical protein KDC57_12890 [Saprospiraceae bacterium]|nr:hypothetical protein [Saprospiraceae bacterium]
MKEHTTNYFNTLIEIAEDSPVDHAEIPALKGDKKTVAYLQYELLIDHPYRYTSDDLIFKCHALRQEIEPVEWKEARTVFFSKGQACMRASPLTKRYGWGVHSDREGKIALVPAESATYQKLRDDGQVDKVKAMRSKRK